MSELEHRSRHQYQPDHVGFDDTRRGRAPPSNPLREAIVKTPTTAREVYRALTRAWTVPNMGATATPTAVKILLAQSAVETASWTACQNWNLGGIKAGHPEKQKHFLMETMEDWPARKAEGAVAWQKKIRPDNPEVVFKSDKNLAMPGKLRVWILAYFRTWPDLDAAAGGFTATIGGGYRAALQFAYAGQPEQYASAISEEVRGAGRGYFSGPSAAYGRLMRGHFNRFMAANLD